MNRQQSPEATDIETERATLPWTQYVSRFEVMPPGAIPLVEFHKDQSDPFVLAAGSSGGFGAARGAEALGRGLCPTTAPLRWGLQQAQRVDLKVFKILRSTEEQATRSHSQTLTSALLPLAW